MKIRFSISALIRATIAAAAVALAVAIADGVIFSWAIVVVFVMLKPPY
jgi:hypothetical protein